MKKLLNTLFVTTQGAYLCKDGETVCVRIESEDKLRLPIHTLGGIVCFGQVSCSPFLLGHCAENNVAVSFMTENGRFLASRPVQVESRSLSLDHRRSSCLPLTAIASARFWPTRTTRRLPRVMPV